MCEVSVTPALGPSIDTKCLINVITKRKNERFLPKLHFWPCQTIKIMKFPSSHNNTNKNKINNDDGSY